MSAWRFHTGQLVRVRASSPPGHVRTPWYTRGCCGVIEAQAGAFANPEELAYGRSGLPPVPLYRVRFAQSALWPDYAGAACDTLVVDVYEHWLEPVAPAAPARAARARREAKGKQR
jgi:Nitrile hydratase beta subunit, C-terminal